MATAIADYTAAKPLSSFLNHSYVAELAAQLRNAYRNHLSVTGARDPVQRTGLVVCGDFPRWEDVVSVLGKAYKEIEPGSGLAWNMPGFYEALRERLAQMAAKIPRLFPRKRAAS